ncbi:MAG: hypothetical protein LWW93_15970 [Hyphomicrobiales bacterium]|nr:hypothetical protein [Hyphomicrobiales bacterium]
MIIDVALDILKARGEAA